MSQVLPQPQVAYIVDYDSDTSDVRPGTKVEARSAASMQPRRESRQTEQQMQVVRGRERSNTTMRPPAPPVRQSSQLGRRSSTPVGVQEANRARAGVYRTESQSRRVQVHPAQGLPRSSSRSRPMPDICRDPNCANPECMSADFARPRSTAPPPPASYPQPMPVNRPTVQAMPAYSNAHIVTGYGPQPRARTNSFTQQRPTSWAAPASLPYYSQPQQHGPPPSPSAYHNPSANVYRQPTYPSNTTTGAYLQPAYSQPPPINAMAAMSINRPTSAVYSARQLAPQSSSSDPVTSASTQAPPLARTSSLSARRPSVSRQIMPGSFPGQSATDDLYHSDGYDSGSDRDHHRSKRDSKITSTPPRPSVRSTQTTPNFSARTIGDVSQRAPYPDTGVDFLRYESADSDRTPRPSDSRRYSSANSSSRSRRPSVSTASSSGRTKATTVSSGSGSARQLIEDRDGRRREYQARDRRAESYADQQLAAAMAYQRQMQGPQPAELSAENIRQMDEQKLLPARSRASGHSRKSGQSGSRSEGVRITYRDSTVLVDGNTTVEIRAAEEGRPEQIILTPMSKENVPTRTESKSSGSRVGRSRGGSDRGSMSREQPIAEVREV